MEYWKRLAGVTIVTNEREQWLAPNVLAIFLNNEEGIRIVISQIEVSHSKKKFDVSDLQSEIRWNFTSYKS